MFEPIICIKSIKIESEPPFKLASKTQCTKNESQVAKQYFYDICEDCSRKRKINSNVM